MIATLGRGEWQCFFVEVGAEVTDSVDLIEVGEFGGERQGVVSLSERPGVFGAAGEWEDCGALVWEIKVFFTIKRIKVS